MGSYRYRSLIEGLYIPYRSLIEALCTLNSPPVVSFRSNSPAPPRPPGLEAERGGLEGDRGNVRAAHGRRKSGANPINSIGANP